MSNYIKTIDKLYTNGIISSKQLSRHERIYKDSNFEQRNRLDSAYKEIFKDELDTLSRKSTEMLKINRNVSIICNWVQLWSYIGIIWIVYTIYMIMKNSNF